jgi:hypothetical protein
MRWGVSACWDRINCHPTINMQVMVTRKGGTKPAAAFCMRTFQPLKYQLKEMTRTLGVDDDDDDPNILE